MHPECSWGNGGHPETHCPHHVGPAAPGGCRAGWWEALHQDGSIIASSSAPGQRGSGGRVIAVEAEAVPSPAAARSAEPAGVPGAIHGGQVAGEPAGGQDPRAGDQAGVREDASQAPGGSHGALPLLQLGQGCNRTVMKLPEGFLSASPPHNPPRCSPPLLAAHPCLHREGSLRALITVIHRPARQSAALSLHRLREIIDSPVPRTQPVLYSASAALPGSAAA